ncbi:MAG: nuclear transport factor 2 family protein [Acidobacteriota bacterium]|nr:nuclear transport factor 2 family protein [Acidobacteriota bacterium]
MKKFTFLFVLVGISTLFYGYNVWADEKEKEAARVPLENYLKGHATGNPEFMRKAFHTEGKMIFVREGKYSTRTFEEYIAGMKDGKPAANEAQRKRWIESIDVAGNAAVGKIILDYPSGKFVDYMTLLKIDGEWKIVNKSFHFEPKAQPQKTE